MIVCGVCCRGWEKLYVVLTVDALLFYKDQKHAKAVSDRLLLLLCRFTQLTFAAIISLFCLLHFFVTAASYFFERSV